jgi:hypothetical protein
MCSIHSTACYTFPPLYAKTCHVPGHRPTAFSVSAENYANCQLCLVTSERWRLHNGLFGMFGTGLKGHTTSCSWTTASFQSRRFERWPDNTWHLAKTYDRTAPLCHYPVFVFIYSENSMCTGRQLQGPNTCWYHKLIFMDFETKGIIFSIVLDFKISGFISEFRWNVKPR